MNNAFAKVVITAAAILFSAHAAFAHAEFVKATPAPDSTITTCPTEIDITFSEDLSLKFSGAKLTDSKMVVLPTGPASLAKDDEKTLVTPITAPLPAGDYAVAWHNLSKDGHKLKGNFKFTVKP
ncbi:MAG: copper homeostasis periplasmic binding protein CopC [Aestuariivirga sp.]